MIKFKDMSCGCLKKISQSKTHGLSNSRIFHVWTGMKERCYNKNYPKYKLYGARGIVVCDEWKDDFMTFYNWAMDNGYKEGLTIDRIDVNGNYDPSNCRWTDIKTQNRNRRNTPYYTINNETKSLAEWCKILNLKYGTVYARLHWPIERALGLEVKP